MGKHTNKGPQKSSVGQWGHTPDSAYAKSKKMEEHHYLYKQKQKED
ncbi:hypothetical protein ACFDTO_13360 [Microbacteriaceae bacterium 4G12]